MKMYQRNVTDAFIHMDTQANLSSIIDQFIVPRVILGNSVKENKPVIHNKSDDKKIVEKASEDEILVLESIFENLNLPLKKRQALLGLSPYMMNKLKISIIEKGYSLQLDINLGKEFGGKIVLLALTDKGHDVIGKEPYLPRPYKRESLEHVWWKYNLWLSYKNKNIPAEIEQVRNGKHVDIGIRINEQNIAIEVELSAKNAITNIIQDIKVGFDRVLSCSKSKTLEKAIIQQFESHPDYLKLKDKIEFRQLSDSGFVKEIAK